MINKLSEENKNEFEWEDYVLDFEIEILSLPDDIGIGSRAYVKENKQFYLLNSTRQWIKINLGKSYSVNRGTNQVVYNGGTI